MANHAPEPPVHTSISLVEIVRIFPDDETAEQWFIQQRWPNGITCVRCGSDNINVRTAHKSMPHRCRACDTRFSVRLGTVLQCSNLGYPVWGMALYLMSTHPKGLSRMPLHRYLGITQKSAWDLAHRIREGWHDQNTDGCCTGPVEADEMYIGGREKNKHADKKARCGRGPSGKTAVAGVRDRATGCIRANVVPCTDGPTLKAFVRSMIAPGTPVYTDEARAYVGLEHHETVRHSISEYVRGPVHTHGLESFWALLKRGYHGTCHTMSLRHLDRYLTEFVGRHNMRSLDIRDPLQMLVASMRGRRLRYADLIQAT